MLKSTRGSRSRVPRWCWASLPMNGLQAHYEYLLYIRIFLFLSFGWKKILSIPLALFWKNKCHLQGLRLSAFQGTSYNLWHHIFKRKKSQIIRFYIVNYLHLHTNYYYVNFKSYTANT